MSVYVDGEPKGRVRFTHMVADTPEELEEMAEAIGNVGELRGSGWMAHYAITAEQRSMAIELGAVALKPKAFAEYLKGRRG